MPGSAQGFTATQRRSLTAMTVLPAAFVTILGGPTSFLPLAVRYLAPTFIGLTLCLALILDGIVGKRQRLTNLLAVITAGAAFGAPTVRSTEWDGWRAASDYVAAEVPLDGVVLFNAGFVESQERDQIAVATRDDLPFAPLSLYPIPQRDVTLIPSTSSHDETIAMVNALVTRFADSGVLAVMISGNPTFMSVMTAFLQREGHHSLPEFETNGVAVGVYQRVRT